MGFYEKVLNNISYIISDKHMELNVVAENAGFTLEEFRNILDGKKVLRAGQIPAIACAMGVDPNSVYFYKESKSA